MVEIRHKSGYVVTVHKADNKCAISQPHCTKLIRGVIVEIIIDGGLGNVGDTTSAAEQLAYTSKWMQSISRAIIISMQPL